MSKLAKIPFLKWHGALKNEMKTNTSWELLVR
jgi:hypothetical protein